MFVVVNSFLPKPVVFSQKLFHSKSPGEIIDYFVEIASPKALRKKVLATARNMIKLNEII